MRNRNISEGSNGKKARLKDVARIAGVSTATVSRVVGGTARVNPEIEERVRNAAARLGISLRRKSKTNIIAFILSNRDMLHPVHSHILVGAQVDCVQHDYYTLFLPFHYPTHTPWRELQVPPILRRRDVVDGFIVAGANSPNFLELLRDTGLPFSVLGNNVLGDWRHQETDTVWIDDLSGAYELTRYVQSQGHSDIWFVANCKFPWFARRYQGYSRAMREAGLKPRLSGLDSERQEEVGYLATKSILARKEPISAVLAGDDATACGVYEAARDCGLRIPEDLAVTGFNDMAGSALLQPPLTTVQIFPEQTGKKLAELLFNRIAQPDLPPQQSTIPTRLVKRESSALLIPERAY